MHEPSLAGPFIWLITTILNLYSWVLIIHIILHWLIAFNIINPYQPLIQKVNLILHRLTEPVLSKVRKYMPELGGIDISPIAVFIGIEFLIRLIYSMFGYY